ncbi:hypothetical protein Pla22_31680 [Rubripirellula amarantea]|uniref:Uncharacterized protein n=1 Tax=Rubripirellula amarantea TaxID=2527999 RepID=A0A5C5WJZ4_9BACT|nr:hypothetical protein [Rubripirellula amarantea]TWT50425.1 hypothetical protein Pla22_31680 [Rubripirellula amarantea]
MTGNGGTADIATARVASTGGGDLVVRLTQQGGTGGSSSSSTGGDGGTVNVASLSGQLDSVGSAVLRRTIAAGTGGDTTDGQAGAAGDAIANFAESSGTNSLLDVSLTSYGGRSGLGQSGDTQSAVGISASVVASVGSLVEVEATSTVDVVPSASSVGRVGFIHFARDVDAASVATSLMSQSLANETFGVVGGSLVDPSTIAATGSWGASYRDSGVGQHSVRVSTNITLNTDQFIDHRDVGRNLGRASLKSFFGDWLHG